MLLSRANSAPAITFAIPIPSVVVTPTPTRGSLQVHPTTAGQSSPLVHSQPRPPRCLTPYPDRSSCPHALHPSPLSSPAFSACSMSSGNNDDDNEDEEDDDDVSDVELEVSINEPSVTSNEVMSPGAKARAANARLLAPALHMSHLNSPTDHKFREMPLSPMRRLKMQSAASSPAGSPVLLPTLLFDQHDLTDDCLSKMTKGSEDEVKQDGAVQHVSMQDSKGEQGTAGHIDIEVKSRVVSVDDVLSPSSEGEQQGMGAYCGQVLQVHVETVD